jgi:hypothetical protein
MNTKYKITILLTTLIVLALSVGLTYAQDNGNGDGVPANNMDEFQTHAFNYGGIGFANAQSGEQWNDQERGNMRGNNQQGGTDGTGIYTMLPPATEEELSDVAVEAMIDGWVDEQHAYAVYEMVMEQFGEVAPFLNIQRSEAQHAAAWEFLFDRYDIPVPEMPEFEALPELTSLEEACQIAADAEIANFELYDDMAELFSDYPDILQIVMALRNASEFSHLPTFLSCAS